MSGIPGMQWGINDKGVWVLFQCTQFDGECIIREKVAGVFRSAEKAIDDLIDHGYDNIRIDVHNGNIYSDQKHFGVEGERDSFYDWGKIVFIKYSD